MRDFSAAGFFAKRSIVLVANPRSCSSMAYVAACRIVMQARDLADAGRSTIRRKIGVLVSICVRRIRFPMESGCYCKAVFAAAAQSLVAIAVDTR
ncbi:hypothetical protein QA633_39490 [Bradyrhizobium barranii]|uniref:hypothetical protein n=1 Tax=Bradyrhizobium barranii TaxID=2992140 RepID=UPI0024AEBA2B|nr:hypothetical protein [Bradyrhizobium barranii]WFT94304.1 hypothetical protein QA633_39490 [Bradyrhizobium barranii]